MFHGDSVDLWTPKPILSWCDYKMRGKNSNVRTLPLDVVKLFVMLAAVYEGGYQRLAVP